MVLWLRSTDFTRVYLGFRLLFNPSSLPSKSSCWRNAGLQPSRDSGHLDGSGASRALKYSTFVSFRRLSNCQRRHHHPHHHH